MAKRKTTLFVTTSRSDFTSIEPLLALARKSHHLRPVLFATGDHYSRPAGETYHQIRARGFVIDASHRLRETTSALQVAEVVEAVASVLRRHHVEYAVLCGDRKEMFAAAVACAIQGVPVFHIHGGDVTYGMIDDALRHAITKLAAVHFAATPLSARRILAMGEEPWRVFVTGSPDADNIGALPEREVFRRFKIKKREYALLLLNPETLQGVSAHRRMAESLLRALKDAYLGTVLVLNPNNDSGADAIRAAYTRLPKRFVPIRGLPREEYLALLKHASFLIGNSSSGITEAATFRTPVVNVGNRQDGRERSVNVIDAKAETASISRAIREVTGIRFRKSLKGLRSPYGKGGASRRIFKTLVSLLTSKTYSEFLYKKFILH